MIVTRAKTKRDSRYPLLTNIELVLDATGLATSTNNSYGEVDGSNVIVSWKGISPGTTGRDFSVIGSGVTFDPTTKSIAFNGSGRLRSGSAASVWDFMSYRAVYADIKWTAFLVCKIGTSIKPASANYGLFGNTGGSSANKGVFVNYANNSTNEDTMSLNVCRGTGAQYLGRMLVPGAGPSNQYCVVTVQMDGSATANSRMRLYINDQALLFNEQLNNNTSPQTTPTYALEIGGVGNSVLPMVGNIKEVILSSAATSYDNTIGVIRSLMNKHRIVRSTANYLDVSTVPMLFEQSAGSPSLQYHLCGIISQNPVNKYQFFSAYSEGDSHVYAANKRLVGRIGSISNPQAASNVAAQLTIYNPGDPRAIQDCGGGFDSLGRMHIFVDVLTSGSAGGCVEARHIYSDDLSTWTNTEITSSLHSDGLLCWRMYGNMIDIGGVLIKGYYKITDQGNTTSCASYVLRSTDRTTWTSVTVKAADGTYINEPSVFWAGGNNIGYLARNEATGEWSISMSTDLGLTWSAFQSVTFGETVVSANPPMVKTFTHNGVLVCVAYITNRNNDTAFAIYGKASSIVSDPVNGWDLDTKIMWWKTSVAPYHYHYGDVAHIDDSIRGLGLWTYDQWPGGGSGSISIMNYTTMPTWHIAKIESELAI